MAKRHKLTIMVVPEGGRQTRTFHLSSGGLRALVLGGLAALLLLSLLVGSWWYLAARAQTAGVLEAELARVYVDRERLNALVAALEEVEGGYERLRGMFAPESEVGGAHLWLPSAALRRSGEGRAVQEGESAPTSWPLSERGVVTRALVEGGEEGHTGIDIAIPTGSYIRAAGAGTVVEQGYDPVYGLFLALDHGDGYRTLYAHASALLVEQGDRIRRNEVIGLTGSTGQSTAPHLHFEVLRDGEPIDPLDLVTQP